MLSLYSGAAVTLFSPGCKSKSNIAAKPWMHPYLLSHICDAKTIKAIGDAYRKKVTDEDSGNKLMDILFTDGTQSAVSSSSADSVINSYLEQKSHNDFVNGNTVTVNGWVLSYTEARQCALYSFTKK